MTTQTGLLGMPAREAAQWLGVSPGTIRRWTDLGLIRHARTPGGHRRYRSEDLERFAADHLTTGLTAEEQHRTL